MIYLIGAAALGVLVLLIALTAVLLRRVVPTNMVHIVQSGKKTTAYGKGQKAGNVYYFFPSWLPVLGVTVTALPESVFVVGLDNYAAYDTGRLPFMVDVRAFFRIADSDMAANRVATFAELHTQLTAILQGSVRRVLAEHKLEEILGMRAELGSTFTKEVEGQLAAWGVTSVKSIEFMDMRDSQNSTVIHDIMSKEQSRISRDSRIAQAANAQQAQQAEIDAQREVGLQDQLAREAVGIRTAEQEQRVGIAKEQSQQQVLAEAKTTAERDLEVKQVEQVRAAEIAKRVAETLAEQQKSVAETNAAADKNAGVIMAEGEKQRTALVAEGELAAAKNDAEGIKARGEATAKAKELYGLAETAPQITLAKEIGENSGYQTYLVTLEQVKATMTVGVEMAKAISNADLKVIANSGDVQSGVAGLGDMFSAKGGTSIAAMLAALSQTPEGKAVVDRLGGAGTEKSK